ncbi:glycosyltransferase [Bacillus nakamurai]|uniref:glycosyltransferase n=1 Tax=Bacillus nakamurai TaxID=1793963 RepID=UPI001E3B005C|nr:hypothetical protein [Bacillus nakamurai]MCC9022353.1 hypothetical protein [Bacillus nakamurai]
MGVSIIIPIKVNSIDEVYIDFINYIVDFSSNVLTRDVEIIIANGSSKNNYIFANEHLKHLKNVIHFIPHRSIRTGDNDKLNGIYSALMYTKYENILLVDDHYRVSSETLAEILKYYEKYDCFKFMPKLHRYPHSALIDTCGMFIVNVLDSRKQYCGHLAFKKRLYSEWGFINRDSLFDEFAMEKHLRKKGSSVGFIKDIALEAKQEIPLSKFLEQRVRYAYENFATPFRFTFFATILPLLILLSLIDMNYSLTLASFLTSSIIVISIVGQFIYGRHITPWYTSLYSPIWFWFYPFTTWIAIYKYLTGGIMFGGNNIRRAG